VVADRLQVTDGLSRQRLLFPLSAGFLVLDASRKPLISRAKAFK
jgi:hypothetical protein